MGRDETVDMVNDLGNDNFVDFKDKAKAELDSMVKTELDKIQKDAETEIGIKHEEEPKKPEPDDKGDEGKDD